MQSTQSRLPRTIYTLKGRHDTGAYFRTESSTVDLGISPPTLRACSVEENTVLHTKGRPVARLNMRLARPPCAVLLIVTDFCADPTTGTRMGGKQCLFWTTMSTCRCALMSLSSEQSLLSCSVHTQRREAGDEAALNEVLYWIDFPMAEVLQVWYWHG
jgi:hypothetical protein